MKLIIFAIALLPTNAFALSPNCERTDQRGMNECAYENYMAADKSLNHKYKIVMDCFQRDSIDAKSLIESQRSWIKFRDADCLFQAPTDNGTMAPQLRSECLKDVTEQREKTFDSWIACAGGEAGAVCPTILCTIKKPLP